MTSYKCFEGKPLDQSMPVVTLHGVTAKASQHINDPRLEQSVV
jgi:hypothetical protein